MRGMIARADQPALLRAVVDEEHGALAGLPDERTRGREVRRGHGGVVVRARMHRVALERDAHSVRILVRAEHDVFVAQFGVGTANHADHVHRRCRESLEPYREIDLRLSLERLTHRRMHEVGRRRASSQCRRRRDARRAVRGAGHCVVDVVRAATARGGNDLERAIDCRVGDEDHGRGAAAGEAPDGRVHGGIRVSRRKGVAVLADRPLRWSKERGRDDPPTNVSRGIRCVRDPEHGTGCLGGHDA